jgi:hypothetical protein
MGTVAPEPNHFFTQSHTEFRHQILIALSPQFVPVCECSWNAATSRLNNMFTNCICIDGRQFVVPEDRLWRRAVARLCCLDCHEKILIEIVPIKEWNLRYDSRKGDCNPACCTPQIRANKAPEWRYQAKKARREGVIITPLMSRIVLHAPQEWEND